MTLVGRDGIRRVHGCLVDVDLKDGQVLDRVRRHGILGLGRRLHDAGVPRDRIVPAFRLTALREPAQPAGV